MEIIRSAIGIFLIIYGTISFAGIALKVSDMLDTERKAFKKRISLTAILSVAMFSVGMAIMIN